MEQTITLTVPALIFWLEWARETAKDDLQVHNSVERASIISGTIDTDLVKEITE